MTNNDNFVNKDYYSRYAFLPSEKNLPFVNYFQYNWEERYIPLYSAFKYRKIFAMMTFKEEPYQMNASHHIDLQWDFSKPMNTTLKNYYFKESDVNGVTKSLAALNAIC